MFRSLLLVAAFTAPTAAYAGCENYTDGSLKAPAPKVTICFDGKCEKTTLDYSCANVHSAQTGYANGWRIEETSPEEGKPETKESIFVYKVLDPKNYAKMTCKSDDEEACALFPLVPSSAK